MERSLRVGLISPYSHISAMGLRQISACLKLAGWDTRMIFLPDPEELLCAPCPHQHDYPPDVLDQVCDLCADVDVVGISVMSNFVGRARALTEAIHERLSIPAIWGGIHPTVKPAECLAWADLVCVGEGEEAIIELVNRMAANQDYMDIPNIWLKDDTNRIIANPIRPLNRSLDDLPLPDYALSQQYILHRGQVVPLTPALLAYHLLISFDGKPQVAYMTYTTRSCPCDCSYCCNSAFARMYSDWRQLRQRSPEYIIAEIDAVRQLIPGLQAVTFTDSTFLAAGTDRIRRFSEMYREQIDLPFFILTTPGSVTEEKLRYLVEAGLQDVEMGIETGSQRIRTLFNRPENNDQVLAAAQCLHRFQKWIPRPRYDLISDNPYETCIDRLETLRLLYQLPRPFLLYIFSLTFYPGTELYRRAKADGLIHDEEQEIYRKNYVQPEPTYYNFVLWGMHRNLPCWFLWLLIQPLVFRVLGSTVMGWLFRLLWKAITTLRMWRARRIHVQQESRISRLALGE